MSEYLNYILIFILGFVFIVGVYNRFIKQKQRVNEAWSGIDVQLKRRAELIPSLVEVVKGYAKHEDNLLTEIAAIRSKSLHAQEQQISIEERGLLEASLAKYIGELFMVVENYPELKADKSFLELQNTLIDIEDMLQMARRYYNGTVRDMNILVQSFPSSIIAKVFKFQVASFFEVENPIDKLAPSIEVINS